ncbi:MAG: NADP-dependent oxidoreductase [Vulcanimicrobiaceae bacterium]
MSAVRSREIQLVARPNGAPQASDFALAERELNEPAAGQILVRNIYMSVDPYMRGRMNAGRSYAPPFEIGEPLTGGAVGEVIGSRDPRLPVGSFVLTNFGWREYALCGGDAAERVDSTLAPLGTFLGALGMPGMTAYVGLFEIGKLRAGETLFVSSAAGAVGSMAGQLARIRGARVIGSVGSPEKVAFVREQLGFDAAIDYHAGDIDGALRRAAPDGIEVYFDNVGGEQLRAAIGALRPFGRIVACGMISQYNAPTPGPENLALIVGKRLTMRGFIVSDHAAMRPVFLQEVADYVRDGKLRTPLTIVDGLQRAPQALIDLVVGGPQVGKLLVRLAPDSSR